MNLFNFIKSQLSITDVVSEYVSLRKAGTYLKGSCPFHHEKDASFTVSPDKGIFFCFGCQAGGDVITFISKTEQCSQIDSAKHLIDRYNISVPESLSTDIAKSKEELENKKQYFSTCGAAALWAHEQLKKYNPPMEYINSRNIDTKSIETFKIGYFPGGSKAINSLVSEMNKKNILVKDLLTANILFDGQGSKYSPFEEHIIFPIKDSQGRFCGFGGRVFREHDERSKYYNSRESAFFIKGSLLFGLDLAKTSIQKQKVVFLVEGYTDCVAMVQHGFTNTVATLGTACTKEHLKQLSRYAEQLYVLYDGDAAGQKAILRLTELCWGVDLELNVIVLPSQDDPASFLEKGGNIQELANSAQNIFTFFTNTLGENFSQTSPLQQKLTIVRKFIAIIRRLDDSLKQDLLLQKASQTFDLPFDSLKQELNKNGPRTESYSSTRQNKETETPIEKDLLKQIPTLEKKLFSAILNDSKFLASEHQQYVLEYLSSPLQNILKKIRKTCEKHNECGIDIWFGELDKDEQATTSRFMMEFETDSSEKTYTMLLSQFYKKYWKKILNDIKLKLAQANENGDKKMVEHLLVEFTTFKAKLVNKGLI
ncbi:DNA primase [bacterium]|jgi:DNA primase|nr:DNA primase [bacterium]